MLTIKNAVRKRLLLVFFAATFLAGCTPPGPRALLQGKKLVEQNRYTEAVQQLRIATSLLSSNAHAWNYLGVACHHAGMITNAEQAYQKALTFDHDLAEAHYNLGCLRLEHNQLDSAKSDLTAFTSLRRNSPDGWVKLAAAQLRSVRNAPGQARISELAVAEKSYREALRLGPQNAEALNGLGLIQVERNRTQEAAQYFKQALKLDPEYPPALLNLAIVSQVYLHDRSSALDQYRAYLAVGGNKADEENVRATVGVLEQELRALRPTSQTAPVAPTVATNAAKTPSANPVRAVAAPSADPATNIIKRAFVAPPVERKPEVVKVAPESSHKLAQDDSPPPKNPPSVSSTIRDAAPKVESDKARSEKPGLLSRMNPLSRRQGESKSNSQPASRTGSASATEAAVGKSTQLASETIPASLAAGARYAYRAPAKPAPGDAAAALRAFAQGFQAQQANHLPEALQSYRRATQLDPADFDAYYNLGLTAAALGNQQQALVAYEYALAIRPESPDARYNFALLLKRANYLIDAINELNKLLSRYPEEPRAHLALGNMYAQVLQQPADARRYYLKVLEIDPHNSQAAAIRNWMIANPP